jgi:hypothetical protein
VDAGAYFSELDQEFAGQQHFPFPDADHIVLGVFEGKVKELGLFRREPVSRKFVGRAVVADAS